MRGRPSCLLQSARGEANRILSASALSSMRIICPNRISWRDWIIAVSLGCFVSLRTSSFRTNWYHLMPSSICRHHWSSVSILHAFVLDIAQQSEPYRNIGKMCTEESSEMQMHLLWQMLNCMISSKVRKPSFQLLCTSLCSGCYGKYLSWFSVLNIAKRASASKWRSNVDSVDTGSDLWWVIWKCNRGPLLRHTVEL